MWNTPNIVMSVSYPVALDFRVCLPEDAPGLYRAGDSTQSYAEFFNALSAQLATDASDDYLTMPSAGNRRVLVAVGPRNEHWAAPRVGVWFLSMDSATTEVDVFTGPDFDDDVEDWGLLIQAYLKGLDQEPSAVTIREHKSEGDVVTQTISPIPDLPDYVQVEYHER